MLIVTYLLSPLFFFTFHIEVKKILEIVFTAGRWKILSYLGQKSQSVKNFVGFFGDLKARRIASEI